jgi:hypothetical protein
VRKGYMEKRAGFKKVKIISGRPYTIDVSQELKGKITCPS